MGHGTTFQKTKKTPEEILYFAELFKKYKCQFLFYVMLFTVSVFCVLYVSEHSQK